MTPPAILAAPARQRLLVLLVAAGLGQAALMIAGAYSLGRFLSGSADQTSLVHLCAMLLFGISALFAYAAGRWLAERFGQSYVAVCRVRLLKAIVRSGGETSRHGITMTRLITDLSSIKNWVSQGIAGGAAHAAGLIGLIVGAWLISPAALFAIATAILTSAGLIACIVLPLQRSIREARAVRGTLAAHVGEATLIAPTIRNFGTLDRKKSEIYRRSNRLAEKLSLRYCWASLLRQSPELGFLLGVATLAFIEQRGQAADVGGTAMGVLLLAAAAAALRRMAQSLDLWLSYAEARRKLAAALDGAGPSAVPWHGTGPLGVSCRRARPTATCRRSSFDIVAEEQVAFSAGEGVRRLFRIIAGLSSPDAGKVALVTPSGEERAAKKTNLAALLVAPDLPLQKGTLRSNLTSVGADVDEERVLSVARHCDIHRDGADQRSLMDMRIGEAGRDLSPSLSARLQLARAVLADPGILLIDDPIFEIDAEAKHALNRIVQMESLTVLIVVHGFVAPIPIHRHFYEDRGRLVEDEIEADAAFKPKHLRIMTP